MAGSCEQEVDEPKVFGTIRSLHALMLDPSTSDGERENAMNRIDHLLEKNGLILDDVLFGPNKKKKVERHCRICSKPGHNARTCQDRDAEVDQVKKPVVEVIPGYSIECPGCNDALFVNQNEIYTYINKTLRCLRCREQFTITYNARRTKQNRIA